jgi:hypothetical protein
MLLDLDRNSRVSSGPTTPFRLINIDHSDPSSHPSRTSRHRPTEIGNSPPSSLFHKVHTSVSERKGTGCFCSIMSKKLHPSWIPIDHLALELLAALISLDSLRNISKGRTLHLIRKFQLIIQSPDDLTLIETMRTNNHRRHEKDESWRRNVAVFIYFLDDLSNATPSSGSSDNFSCLMGAC